MRMNSQLKLILSTIAATLCGSFSLGIHAGSNNSLTPILTKYINDSLSDHYSSWNYEPTTMAILFSIYIVQTAVGGVLGNVFLATRLANTYDRRKTLIWCSWASIPVLCLTVLATFVNSFELLFICRLFVGVIIGCCQSVGSTYIMELAPPSQGGQLGVAVSGMFWFGLAISVVLTFPQAFGTVVLWHYVYVIFIGFAIIQLILLHFVAPESPSFLYSKGQTTEAHAVLQSVNKPKADIKALIDQIEQQLSMQKDNLSISQLFTNGVSLRRAAILACLFGATMPLAGVTAVVSFSTVLYVDFGFSSSTAVLFTLGTSIFGALITLSTVIYIRRINRRTVILTSMMIVIACLLAMTVSEYLFEATHNTFYGWCYVIAANVYIAAFTGGFGAICWFIATELVPQNARAANQALAMMCLNASLIVTVFGFWTVRSLIGSFSYIMIASIAIVWIYAYFRLPETRNRKMPDIMADLAKPTVFSRQVVYPDIQLEKQ